MKWLASSFVKYLPLKSLTQGKNSGSSIVDPESGAVRDRIITEWCKFYDEAIECETSSLLKAIHSFADFIIHKSIISEKVIKIILLSYFFGDPFEWYTTIFIIRHFRLEEEIFDIHGHKTCVWSGNDAIKENFCIKNICCWCTNIVRARKSIST